MKFLKDKKPFIVAEAGVNHNGQESLALRLVDAAAQAGADAIKFQTFRAEALAARSAVPAQYQKRTGVASQKEMLKSLELTRDAHRVIWKHCQEVGIRFMSTPFDEESADFLDELGVEIFKIPSPEITNHFLLSHIAKKMKPIIMSTGMSTLEEVTLAVDVLRKAGNKDLVLLHCVSNYPAKPEDINLRSMATLKKAFSVPTGYSDHTLGVEVAVAAAALGAAVIEKHFTLDKSLSGPDHLMSLDPQELKHLITALHNASLALGDGVVAPRPAEEEVKLAARKSIVLMQKINKGTPLQHSMLTLKRPATGIPPSQIREVIGKKLRFNAEADTVLKWDMLE